MQADFDMRLRFPLYGHESSSVGRALYHTKLPTIVGRTSHIFRLHGHLECHMPCNVTSGFLGLWTTTSRTILDSTRSYMEIHVGHLMTFRADLYMIVSEDLNV